MKLHLELLILPPPDGRKFLYYRDAVGFDICCEMIGDKLYMWVEDDEDEDIELDDVEITFEQFVDIIEDTAKIHTNAE